MPSHDSPRDHECDVVVIGAGAAGLVAGSTLAGSTDVIVLEAASRPGGRVESVRHGDYWLNIGAQFTEGAGPLFDIMDRYGIERGSLAGRKSGLHLKGRTVTTDFPPQLLLRSKMSPLAKAEMAVVGMRIKYLFWRLMAENPARSRKVRARLDARPGTHLLKGVRSKTMRAMFDTWAGQWIGCDIEETAATQLVVSIGTAIQKASKVPNFALPVGGNQAFTDALADDLGVRLRLGAEVQTITRTQESVTVHYTDATGPRTLTARRAILAVPTDRASTILADVPDELKAALHHTHYGRYVLAGIFTKEQGEQRWDKFYGISTPGLSFQMIFNHAAPLRGQSPRKPGGALVCLAGGTRADELMARTDAEIEAEFLRDLLHIYPELENQIDLVVVKRQPRVVSYWGPGGRSAAQKILRHPLGPIWFAGDFLADPSLAAAAESGHRAAKKILESLA